MEFVLTTSVLVSIILSFVFLYRSFIEWTNSIDEERENEERENEERGFRLYHFFRKSFFVMIAALSLLLLVFAIMPQNSRVAEIWQIAFYVVFDVIGLTCLAIVSKKMQREEEEEILLNEYKKIK